MFLYPPWNAGALRQPRPLLLTPDFSERFSTAVLNIGRPANGLVAEKCFFDIPGLAGIDFFLISRNANGTTTTGETKLVVLVNIMDVLHLHSIREPNSRAGSSFTDHWGCSTVRAKSKRPWLFSCASKLFHNKLSDPLPLQTLSKGQFRSCVELHLRKQ